MHFVGIFNKYVFNICYTSYTYHYICYKTAKVELQYIKKWEFTDIYSNENDIILKYCIHQNVCIKFLTEKFSKKDHKIFSNSNLKMHFCVVEVSWKYWHLHFSVCNRLVNSKKVQFYKKRKNEKIWKIRKIKPENIKKNYMVKSIRNYSYKYVSGNSPKKPLGVINT